MTYLTERQAQRLAERLADLPRLAAQTVTGGPGGTTVGSSVPPGVDLTAVDAGREQPKLLAKLSNCVRTVGEEAPAGVVRIAPSLPPEGRETWHSESAWLLATMGWWQGDDWCAEWVATEVKAVRWALIGLIEEHSHHRTCAICGSPVEAYVMGDYALAECPKCQRVLGMEDVGYRERIAQARAMFAAKVLG